MVLILEVIIEVLKNSDVEYTRPRSASSYKDRVFNKNKDMLVQVNELINSFK